MNAEPDDLMEDTMASEKSTGKSIDEQVARLRKRVTKLEKERSELAERLKRVKDENRDFANQYVEAQEHREAVFDPYVASHRLHATLDPSLGAAARRDGSKAQDGRGLCPAHEIEMKHRTWG